METVRHLSTEDRFWQKVAKSSTCWWWTACVSSSGYGSISVNGKMEEAHRFAYELLVGAIPGKLTLDHLCRNRSCVNPSHLELTTLKENILRGIGSPALNARKAHCKSGHSFNGENTYYCPSGQRVCKICRRRNGRVYRERLKSRRGSANS